MIVGDLPQLTAGSCCAYKLNRQATSWAERTEVHNLDLSKNKTGNKGRELEEIVPGMPF